MASSDNNEGFGPYGFAPHLGRTGRRILGLEIIHAEDAQVARLREVREQDSGDPALDRMWQKIIDRKLDEITTRDSQRVQAPKENEQT